MFHGEDSDNLLQKVQQAHYVYQSTATWRLLIQQAMKQDFSWKIPASTYLSLYRGELWKH